MLDFSNRSPGLRLVVIGAGTMGRGIAQVLAQCGARTLLYDAQPGAARKAKDAIAQESAKAPYVNLIAVREADKDAPWVAKLVEAYHSPEVKAFVEEQFKGSIIAAW